MEKGKEDKKVRFGAMLAALSVSAFSVPFFVHGTDVKGADAGAVAYFEGTESAGAVLKSGNVKLLRQRVEIDIPQIDVNGFDDAATVTTEYLFENPAASDEIVTLLFSYQTVWTGGKDAEKWNHKDGVKITSDGRALPTQLRYSYHGSQFDAEKDALLLTDGFRKDDYLAEQLEAHRYVYSVSLNSEEAESTDNLRCRMLFSGQGRILGGKNNTMWTLVNGYRCLEQQIGSGETIVEFWSLGGKCKLLSHELENAGDKTGLSAEVTLVSEEQTTFGEVVQSFRPEGEISKTDWYNVAVDYLNMGLSNGQYVSLGHLAQEDILRWYEYQMTVPAGGTVENTIRTPFHYADGRDTDSYCYQFGASSSFGGAEEVSLTIKTPYTIYYSNFEFTETEDGYTFSRDSLPIGTLNIFLTDGDDPTTWNIPNREHSLTVALIMLVVVVAGAVVTAVVLTLKTRRIKKSAEEARLRADQLKPEEGKVFLDRVEEKHDETDGENGDGHGK